MTDPATDVAGYLAGPGPFGPLLDTRLRLVTWNLWWRFGPWEARLPAIVETLRRLDADVICLQEVWSEPDTGRTSAGIVAEALGARHVHASHLELDGIGMGNAVVSRWPIVGHEVRALPAPPGFEADEERRLALRADVDGPGGAVQVFTTHLNWRLDHSHIRQHQVRELCRFIAGSPKRTFPAVLCGDMNADPMSVGPPCPSRRWCSSTRGTTPASATGSPGRTPTPTPSRTSSTTAASTSSTAGSPRRAAPATSPAPS